MEGNMVSQEQFAALLRADPQAGYGSDGGDSLLSPRTVEAAPASTSTVGTHYGSVAPSIGGGVGAGGKPPKGGKRQQRKHPARGRSRSDNFVTSPELHPLLKGEGGGGGEAAGGEGRGGGRKLPPRGATPSAPGHGHRGGVTSAGSGVSGIGNGSLSLQPPALPIHHRRRDSGAGSTRSGGGGRRPQHHHRRARSELVVSLAGSGGGREHLRVTKADLQRNLPDPRWGGGAAAKEKVHRRGRSGSNGNSINSGGSLPDWVSSSCPNNPAVVPRVKSAGSFSLRSHGHHVRSKSDASLLPVGSEEAQLRSALVKSVTAGGMVQFQLPKDGFRLLVDGQLEAGAVYKRRLVDDEDQTFLEFHTVEGHSDVEDYGGGGGFDGDGVKCARCRDEYRKRLPPVLFVMSVDGSIYRQILDEVVESKSMPCGTFFCGHHEDVRYPDIRIAVWCVAVFMALLFYVAFILQG